MPRASKIHGHCRLPGLGRDHKGRTKILIYASILAESASVSLPAAFWVTKQSFLRYLLAQHALPTGQIDDEPIGLLGA